MLLHAKVIGEGKPLFILHGFLGSGDNWKTFAKKWSQSGRSIHLLDARNHGKSFHSDQWDYPTMANDVIAYADHNQIDQFEVLGHSMGGKTAMFLATAYPERVQKAVIADIVPKSYPHQHTEILDALYELDQQHFEQRKEAEDFLEPRFESLQLRYFLLKNLERTADNVLRIRCNISRFREDQSTVTHGLEPEMRSELDILFIRGLDSGYISDQDLPLIAHHFPNYQMVSIADAGHWLHAEQPEAFDAAVSRFFDL